MGGESFWGRGFLGFVGKGVCERKGVCGVCGALKLVCVILRKIFFFGCWTKINSIESLWTLLLYFKTVSLFRYNTYQCLVEEVENYGEDRLGMLYFMFTLRNVNNQVLPARQSFNRCPNYNFPNTRKCFQKLYLYTAPYY